jgi:SAM-dependent methyltransferase
LSDRWDELFDELYLKTYADREPGDPREEALGAASLAGVEPPADRSQVLLDEARRRSGGRDWPEWVRADHRELPFDDASFDAVLTLFSSLGYRGEEGDRATLRELRRVLRPAGALVIETQHRDRIMAIFREEGWQDLGEGALRLEARRMDYAAGEIETDFILIEADGSRHSLTYRLRLYTATELVGLLEAAGFDDVECFGGFGREPLSRETRLFVLAR